MPAYRLHYLQAGAPAWTTVDLTKPVFNIGSVAGNDLALNHPFFSAYHARLQIDQANIWLIDLNSTNGVTINGARITPNEWVLLAPGSAFEIGPLTLRVSVAQAAFQPQPQVPQPWLQPQPRYQPQPQARPSAQRSKLPLLAVGGALGLCLVIGILVIIGAGWLIYPNLAGVLPAGNPSAQANANATAEATVKVDLAPPVAVAAQTLTASDGRLQDEHGAVLEIPADVLPPEENLTLATAKLSTGMQSELEQEYTVDSLAYSITANGMDGVGRASLSLPAPSPKSQLAVLVDDQFLAILPNEPQNGVLNVAPFLGAPAADGYPTMAQSVLPNRYFVITPKDTSSQSGELQNRLISYSPQIAPDGFKRCIPLIWRGNRCWTNQAGSVVIMYWNTEMPDSWTNPDPLKWPDAVAGIINTIVNLMTRYQKAGFTNTAISGSNPVYLIISAKESEPTYSQKTGNIYMGWKVVDELSVGKDICTIAHELFHWIEDEEYAMNGAAMMDFRAWWLEMAADNGAYLLDAPACLQKTFDTYRAAEVDDLLAWQATPFEWDMDEGSRYIQSLQMYLAICDGGSHCAVTLSEFIAFINAGSYPSSFQLDRYSSASDDMGLYLLGDHPLFARTDAVSLAAFKTGQGYGDFIWLKDVSAVTVEVSGLNKRITQPNSLEAKVDSPIAKGAVYPLWVSNGKGSSDGGGNGFTAPPGILTVEAGTPLWYSLDNGKGIYHDGSKELVLGAISDKLGIGVVRLVAFAPTEAEQLRATVKLVDLSGDWVNMLSNPVVTTPPCVSSSEGDEEDSGDNAQLQDIDIVSQLSAYGAYVADSTNGDGSHYIWVGELPDGIPANSEITVTPEEIIVEFEVTIPQPEDSSFASWLARLGITPPPAGAGLLGARPSAPANPVLLALILLSAAGLVLLVWLRPRLQPRPALIARGAMLILLSVSASFLLSGCFGFAMWGDISGTYTYQRLEHIDPANPPANLPATAAAMPTAAWLVKGKGDVTWDLHFLVATEDSEGNTTTEESACLVSYTATLDGVVGPADMMPIPETE